MSTTSAKKRGNGQGSISFSKSKNLWLAQYYAFGKRKTLYAKTKTEASNKLAIARSKVLNGTYVESSKITVSQWLEIWLKEYMVNKRAPKTVENAENIIRNHIIPSIGHVQLNDLKPFQVQKMYNSVGEKLSPRTVQLVHITFNSAIKQAISNDLILKNACSKCVLPKQVKSQSRALTKDEQREFVKVISGNQFELAYLLCLYAGLRRGEALALKWSDIDIDNYQISINKTISRCKTINPQKGEPKTQIIIKEPKSKTSNRVVPISPKLVPYIKKHKKHKNLIKLALGKNYSDKNFVFTDSKGNPFDGTVMNKQFQTLTEGLFSEHATVHTLRHTYVTRGAESGISMKVMQELCGHSKIELTANIYTHISDTYKKREASKMEIIL